MKKDDWMNCDKEKFLANDALGMIDVPVIHGTER